MLTLLASHGVISLAPAAFSPRGQRSSPQQVKKSPAASGLMGQSGMGALNFDSPSTAAAMGALGIGGGFDMGLDNVGVGGLDTLGVAFATEDDKLDIQCAATCSSFVSIRR